MIFWPQNKEEEKTFSFVSFFSFFPPFHQTWAQSDARNNKFVWSKILSKVCVRAYSVSRRYLYSVQILALSKQARRIGFNQNSHISLVGSVSKFPSSPFGGKEYWASTNSLILGHVPPSVWCGNQNRGGRRGNSIKFIEFNLEEAGDKKCVSVIPALSTWKWNLALA